MSWAAWIDGACRAIDSDGRWRTIRDFDGAGPAGCVGDQGHGRCSPSTSNEVVSFASNDYLGLTQHPAPKAAAIAAIECWGTGAGAARLITGGRTLHRDLETELAAWKGTESALLFPTGFAANLGALTAFGTGDVTICSDELNHASIIDGTRMSRAAVEVYRHLDLDDLEHRVRSAPGRVLVATDAVFSMDGDVAPIDGLLDLCTRHDALLLVDEAHSVLGPHPDPARCGQVEMLRVGTLSKTLGSLGGFVAGSRRAVDLLVNTARPFIFTTAPAPGDTAAALASLRVLLSGEGEGLIERLRDVVDRVRSGHPSPIIPIVVGDERDALRASAALLERGLLVPAIRPPTVAPGTSRLRVALSAAHTDAQVDRLVAALDDLGLR